MFCVAAVEIVTAARAGAEIAIAAKAANVARLPIIFPTSEIEEKTLLQPRTKRQSHRAPERIEQGTGW
jgi:hypothetical protein